MNIEPFQPDQIKIAVIGGGTGSFTLLSALKNHTSQIAALVNMVDDGGSTGVLRDELGVLPPGDVRQCLVALSTSPKVRDLFNYRFEDGSLGGHSFGNLLLTALEKTTGSFSEAVETASEILNVKGRVVPVTLDDVRLKMEWKDTSTVLSGERVIDVEHFKNDPRKAMLSLVPAPKVNRTAVRAILEADMVVVAPGDLYTSLGPALVIPEIGEALQKTDAICVYACNLVTKQGQTDGFTVTDHADEIERLAGSHFLDIVLYNNERPAEDLLKNYAKEGEQAVQCMKSSEDHGYKTLGARLIAGSTFQTQASDPLALHRTLIRHDSAAIAQLIIDIYHKLKERSAQR